MQTDKDFAWLVLWSLFGIAALMCTFHTIKDHYWSEGYKNGWAKGLKTGRNSSERLFD